MMSAVAIVAAAALGACDVNRALDQVSEAQRLSADLRVQFGNAANASDRAVMAGTDEASTALARDAARASAAVEKDVKSLASILEALHFSQEAGLLVEFSGRFAQYRAVDRDILDLAVENTNLKAQRLSFGAAEDAVASFERSLEALTPREPIRDGWHVKALAAVALANAREIQALEAPHIAEADEAAMAGLEQRMTTSRDAAAAALDRLAEIVETSSHPQLEAARADLARLLQVNGEIVVLSRRNTNVRSLALSLNRKPQVVAACEESLRALQAALDQHKFNGRR